MDNSFYCTACDFGSSKKSNYLLHLLTKKHIKNNSKGSKPLSEPTLHFCTCSKIYASHSALRYHRAKGKCQPSIPPTQTTIINHITNIDNSNSIANNHTNQIQTTNNNQFNLKFFLNDTCKDAMSMTDFVKTLDISLQDLENVGKLGYAEGISQIMLKGLKKMDIEKRPVHCSDVKRETLYIKASDSWIKEGEECTNLKQAVKAVECKNIKQISKWKSANPASSDNTSKTHDQYMRIVGESMGGSTVAEDDKNYGKIIRSIAKSTSLPSKNAISH